MASLKIIILSCFISCFMAKSVYAQQSLEAGLLYARTSGNINSADNIQFFDRDYKDSYGVFMRKTYSSKVYMTGIVQYQKLSYRFFDFGIAESSNANYDLYWQSTALALSMEVGYYFYDSKIIQIGGSAAIKNTIALKDDYEVNVIDSSGSVDLVYDRGSIPSAGFGLDIGFKWRNRLKLTLSPKWSHDLIYFEKNYNRRRVSLLMGLSYVIK